MATVMQSKVSAIGTEVDFVNVQIGPQFLNLFSEHLYSSPNKAFEELVANSWDAGAGCVYIHLPDDLQSPSAAIWVLDNGVSMDVEGFRALWSVATSPKRQGADVGRRQPIGKFGVGKLATYLLAHELTYVCLGSDGIVRAITMDYRRIDDFDRSRLHIDPVPLQVRELHESELSALLASLPEGDKLRRLIADGVPGPEDADFEDEFGGAEPTADSCSGSWTLAVLSSLKRPGHRLATGWIRRLLRTALPLGRSITIMFNEEPLSSAKARVEVENEWQLGPGLALGPLILADDEEVAVSEHSHPYPHLQIPDLGVVTGRVRLYRDRISGGKSEDIEASNGFFVNVRGRVIKPEDPYFGLENLSHSVWSRFRATVRADGLDEQLAVNREAILDSRQLRLVRALLMKLFNKARTKYEVDLAANWLDIGEILTSSYGSLPFQPLRRVLEDSAARGVIQHNFIIVPDGEDLELVAADFKRDLAADPGEIIQDIGVEPLNKAERLVRYDVLQRRVVVNRTTRFQKSTLNRASRFACFVISR